MWLLAFTTVFLLLPFLVGAVSRSNPDFSPLARFLLVLDRAYCKVWHRLELPTGYAPLPETGPALLIANHTSGIDSLLLQAACERRLGFMILQEWYDHWLVHPFCVLLGCIPVKRDGRDVAAMRTALRALEEGRVVPIFPEGRIVPDAGESFAEGRPGAAFIALHTNAPVIPAYLSGAPRTDQIIPSWFTPSRSRVVFGPPVDLSAFQREGQRADRDAVAEVSERLMAAIKSLRETYPPSQPFEDDQAVS